ncbi:MAG TPA: hypothetical protein VK939_14685 [Longimicrobiales bacterium]|nr:hypothetical protein [Longimicrobiales bacterium]
MLYAGLFVNDPIELPPQRRHRRGFQRAGLAPHHERWFNRSLATMVALFGFGWIYTIAYASETDRDALLSTTIIENPLRPDASPPAAFLVDAAVRAFADAAYRGESGAVNVVVQPPGDTLLLPDSLPPGTAIEYAPAGGDTTQSAPSSGSGVWNVLLRMRTGVRTVPDLAVIRLVPLSEKREGRIGSYRIGSWPNERGGARSPQYEPPAGLVRVTPENQDLRVSRHFRLRDFLTKGQQDVWPKYVAMSPRLLDKLELTIDELNASGTPVEHVGVISGFRTPEYNAAGGSTAGRGALSRHMYGDAMDWYVDNDRDGRMDDLNGDGRIDAADGRVIVEAAERVEKKYPHLVGGIGLYRPTGAHSGFVHLDTRGFRARW